MEDRKGRDCLHDDERMTGIQRRNTAMLFLNSSITEPSSHVSVFMCARHTPNVKVFLIVSIVMCPSVKLCN